MNQLANTFEEAFGRLDRLDTQPALCTRNFKPQIEMMLYAISLKILHILDHSLPLHSGYAFRTQSILEAQLSRDWQPVALTSPKHEHSWKKPTVDAEQIGGVRFYRSGATRETAIPFGTELSLMKTLARRIEEVAKIEKPDVLHAHSPVLNAIPALRVGHKLGIPVVYEIRAFWEDAAVDHGTYPEQSLKYKLVRSVETWTCRRVKQVAVLCNGLKQDLIKRGIPEGKLTIVANGINPADFQPCGPDQELADRWGISGKKVLGFIGSFYRYEGLDLLVSAFEKLSVQMDGLVLLLVGGGEMEAELRKQVDRLRVRDRVILTGRIPHEKIPKVYSMMDVLIYPRYSMRLTELVTPLKPLEAMATGKTLIASDIGGHRELINDGFNGILFKPGDVDALVEAVRCVLSDPDFRKQLAQRGRNWALENQTWDKTTGVYTSIYARAVGTTIA
jgi:PEP-CTERM/exosortase A-associated glycosyltransferase